MKYSKYSKCTHSNYKKIKGSKESKEFTDLRERSLNKKTGILFVITKYMTELSEDGKILIIDDR